MSLASSIKFLYYTVSTANPEEPSKLSIPKATTQKKEPQPDNIKPETATAKFPLFALNN
jgi:hypothetical protein